MASLGAKNLPQMTASVYTTSLYDGSGTSQLQTRSNMGQGLGQGLGPGIGPGGALHLYGDTGQKPQKLEQVKMAAPTRRLVKVIIVDPDDKVPLEQCILYNGKEKLTDLTDQELFFEINIKDVLDGHNEIRTKIVDKSVKERTEHLEPIKVRDLRMVVVTVAQF